MTNDVRQVAVALARAAGAVLMQKAAAGFSVASKSTAIDLVTDADKASEAVIVQGIRTKFPNHSIVAEESGKSGEGGPMRWVVDPLDGTVNFAHRLPHWCVLVAAQERLPSGAYETVVGVTLSPTTQEEFVAVRGGGATLNGQPIRVSSTPTLMQSIGATGFGYDRLRKQDDNHAEFCRLNLLTQGLRRAGAAGLDLAYVACGRLDFYWEFGLNPWDLAAGDLLVREAGGVVTDLQNVAVDLFTGNACASNGVLHQAVLRAVGSARNYPVNAREGLGEHLPPDVARTLNT